MSRLHDAGNFARCFTSFGTFQTLRGIESDGFLLDYQKELASPPLLIEGARKWVESSLSSVIRAATRLHESEVVWAGAQSV